MSSRRTLLPAHEAAWVFNRIAREYQRFRPPYPPQLAPWLLKMAGNPREVVELGAGTGLLTVALREGGARVTAVEPALRMAEAIPGQEGIRVVVAPGEDTGLPDGAFGLVVLADAVQWVDGERGPREAARLLQDGGVVAVVEIVWDGSPAQRVAGEFIRRWNPRVGEKAPKNDRGGNFLRATLPGARVVTQTFTDHPLLDEEALGGLLLSHSFVGPLLVGDPVGERLSSLMEAVREVEGPPPWAWPRTVTARAAARWRKGFR